MARLEKVRQIVFFGIVLATGGALHALLTSCGRASAQTTSASGTTQSYFLACDKSYTYSEPGGGPRGGTATVVANYGEQAFPGLTKFDLAAHVTNWVSMVVDGGAEPIYGPPGYELHPQDNVFVRDGYAGAPCQPGGAASYLVYAP